MGCDVSILSKHNLDITSVKLLKTSRNNNPKNCF